MNTRKTVLITGTSSGLGQATAEYFAKNDWNVIATMRKPEVQTRFDRMPNVRTLKLDVVDRDTIAHSVEEAIKLFGAIDVVVNNAGIGVYGALEAVTEDDIKNQYAVNVAGVANVIRAVLPHFRANRAGKFINISSVMGLSTALPLGSLYNMSKFALEGLTEGLYFELKPLNISLHLVEPGGFASSFGANVVLRKSDDIAEYKLITQNVGKALSTAAKPGAVPSPDAIVRVIYDLARGKRKSFRNVVGKDAKAILFLRRLMPIRKFLDLLTKRFNAE